jgi:hypothetical protein
MQPNPARDGFETIIDFSRGACPEDQRCTDHRCRRKDELSPCYHYAHPNPKQLNIRWIYDLALLRTVPSRGLSCNRSIACSISLRDVFSASTTSSIPSTKGVKFKVSAEERSGAVSKIIILSGFHLLNQVLHSRRSQEFRGIRQRSAAGKKNEFGNIRIY